MSMRQSSWASEVFALLVKDIKSELRTRYTLNTLFMFALTTLVIVGFSLGQSGLNSEILSALYWIIIFFASMSALAGVFTREVDGKTAETLRMFAQPSVVYSGKLLYNIILLALLALIVTPLFLVFMNLSVSSWGLFLVVIILGVIGLAGATTIIGAIVAQASMRNALFAVLSFPVLLPLLIAAIKATNEVFINGSFSSAFDYLKLLIAYAVIMITISSLLFEYIWNG